MSNIKLGSHVGMAGKEMFLASAKEAVSYGANVFMLYTGAPQNTRRKEISELNIEAGWKYAKEHGIEEIIVHAPYIINLANTIKPETYELAVEFLEKDGRGLNLTREVRDGILNHRTEGMPYTLEGKVVRLSDKIAYINHDIDDAIRARIFSENDVPHEYSDILGNSTKTRLNTLINDIVANSYGRDDILMSDDIEHAMKSLRQFMFDNLYSNPQAKAEEVKVYKLITELYNYYVSNPDKLPGNYIRFIEEYNQSKERVVCDYIAGMSDHYAIARFEEIYVPRSWKV